MLRAWLAETPLESFIAVDLGRAPIARPFTASGAVPLLQWNTIGRVLAADVADVIVVARGELVDESAPRSLVELTELMARGIGVVVRRAENCDPNLNGLAH